MMRVLVMQGPNMNRLGLRNPAVYGDVTLAELEAALDRFAATRGVGLEHFQSNHEGELVDWLQERLDADAVILNPAGLTTYGMSLFDTLLDAELPVAIVHVSNIYRREAWRHHDRFAELAVCHIAGCGVQGYFLALDALIHRLQRGLGLPPV